MLSLLPTDTPADLPTLLASLKLIAPLLDAMPDVVFFIKDTDARYSLANRTLAERCGHGEQQRLGVLVPADRLRISLLDGDPVGAVHEPFALLELLALPGDDRL